MHMYIQYSYYYNHASMHPQQISYNNTTSKPIQPVTTHILLKQRLYTLSFYKRPHTFCSQRVFWTIVFKSRVK